MNNGWVKLYRKTLMNDLWRHDKTAFNLFQLLMLVADSNTGKWSGGRFQLAEMYGDISPNTIYSAIKRLEKAKMITLSVNNKYTTFYICKWSEYQQTDNTNRQQQSNNKATTKQHSNKNKEVRSKNNTIVLGESPVYGKPEINELFYNWNEIVGYEISSNKAKNRNACNNLLKKYGNDKLLQLLKGVQMSQSDKFAPRISDFVSLQAKLSELLAWGKRQSSTKAKGIIKI